MYDRPEFVGDAIEIGDDNLHVGIYGPYRLHSAYQPIFEHTAENRFSIHAYEGLIRPFRNGMPVSPGNLFSSLEQNDYLFIECMCRALHLRNYPNARPADRKLFVNMDVARYQCFDDMERNFIFFMDRAESYGLKKENVVFEILESELRDEDLLLKTRDMLRESGAQIAIDDFGQQHSNLERYAILRPEVVKIDRGLFINACGNKSLLNLLKAQILQFRDNDAIVLVEGIETQEQFRLASTLGATLYQGYFYEKPTLLPTKFAEEKTICQDVFQSREIPIAS